MRRALALGIALLAGAAGADAQQNNRAMVVVTNKAAMNGPGIVRLFATPPNDNNWGQDLLGSVIIPGGQTVIVDLSNRLSVCVFDVRVVFSNGDTRNWSKVDTCSKSGNLEAWPTQNF